MKVLDFGGTIR